jgi:hypothetical protein
VTKRVRCRAYRTGLRETDVGYLQVIRTESSASVRRSASIARTQATTEFKLALVAVIKLPLLGDAFLSFGGPPSRRGLPDRSRRRRIDRRAP